MAGRVREFDSGRVWAALRRAGHAALFVLLLAACDTFADSSTADLDYPDYTPGVAGTGGTSFGFGGSISVGGGPTLDNCATMRPIFGDQVVVHQQPAHRELYSWTVPEHIAEMRRDKILLIRSEQEGMGRGNAFNAIDRIGVIGVTLQAELARKLSEELFIKIRYAWPHPWATRMGWPDETYGDQLVRIVLKEEAWVARVMGNVIDVFDMENQLVPIEEALLTPERIAAIYYVNDSSSGGPVCGGSFFSGSGGYREFIIGNEAMVAEWSIATQEIRDRIEADADKVADFLALVRGAPPGTSTPGFSSGFNAEVVCDWESGACGERGAYHRALAIPSDNYVPEVAALAALADTLRADPFELDPLVVVPGE